MYHVTDHNSSADTLYQHPILERLQTFIQSTLIHKCEQLQRQFTKSSTCDLVDVEAFSINENDKY